MNGSISLEFIYFNFGFEIERVDGQKWWWSSALINKEFGGNGVIFKSIKIETFLLKMDKT